MPTGMMEEPEEQNVSGITSLYPTEHEMVGVKDEKDEGPDEETAKVIKAVAFADTAT
jgi:hypothetical protein